VPTRRTVLRLLPVAVAGTAGCSAGDGPLLADGFERWLGPWRRGADGFRWSVERTDDRAHEGSWSVHVDTGAGGSAPFGDLREPLGVEAVARVRDDVGARDAARPRPRRRRGECRPGSRRHTLS
jgi:hypothetical protein